MKGRQGIGFAEDMEEWRKVIDEQPPRVSRNVPEPEPEKNIGDKFVGNK